jgi:hypothetical protein
LYAFRRSEPQFDLANDGAWAVESDGLFQLVWFQPGLQGLRVATENEQRTARLEHASSSAGGALNPLACTITVFEP